MPRKRKRSRSAERLAKRCFDCTFAIACLLLLSPLLFIIGAVTFARSGAPVIIRQVRVGRGGRRFELYKFRTLPAANLAISDKQWTPPPADAWGEFLRRTFLDELPQLLNVARGEMSMIGPRPERPHFVREFERKYPGYCRRHQVEVGITGWAQVNGWRGDTSISARLAHDLYYVKRWSLAMDARIMVRTAALMIRELFRGSPAGGEQRAGRSVDARAV
jgi:lipopolysaccharide/colanic/teichoic acid biosynthesis glycosyltransferase